MTSETTYNGQRRSNVLAGGSATGQQWRQGSDGNAPSGGRDEDGTRQADNSRRTETDSGEGVSERITPIRESRFGFVYDQFRGKAREAFDFLRKEKSGYLRGVFHRDDIGDIDLVWGDSPTRHSGKGLAHIIRKHVETLHDFNSAEEAFDVISGVVNDGTVSEGQVPNTYNIEKGNYRVVVAKDAIGNWVLTAFDFKRPASTKKKGTPAALTPGETASADGAGAVAPNLSGSKDKKTSGKMQQPDGKKRGRKQIEKAIGMLREGLASGDFGTVRRALGMYWTNQYNGAEITEEEAAFVDGVLDNYRQQGIEIINPLGTRYDEGMKVVAEFRTDDTLKPGENRIVGVREPQVNTDGVMSHSASITVAISPVAEENGADVQGNADENIRRAESEVERNPTEAQKEAGNYKKGHVKIDGYDITIEQPKGSTRSGVDENGNKWETKMNNTYGYIRGTQSVDGDHIDVFLSDNPTQGNVYVVDQINQETGEFDEHKVMYGFNSMEEAREAYLSNYSEGWKIGTTTEVSKDEFKKWIDSSRRKTKPFSEYSSVNKTAGQNEVRGNLSPSLLDVVNTLYTRGKEVASKLFSMKFFEVGTTPKFMQDLGLRGDKFTIRYGVIARHIGKDSSHTLTESDWEQLPNALQSPFAIAKLTDKEDAYRLYTTLQTQSGEFVVVGVDVKNAGREIEVNSISTVFGRRNNANLPNNEEVIYESKGITPEQSALLKRPDFAQYPTGQELSADKGNETTPNVQEASQQPTRQASASKEKIEDVGEKIGGARKDIVRRYADKIDLDGNTLSKMFPKPDIPLLIDAGLSLEDAASVKSVYDAAKSEYKRHKDTSRCIFYAMYAKHVLNGKRDLDMKYGGYVFTEYGKEYIRANEKAYAELYRRLGNSYSSIDLSDFAIIPRSGIKGVDFKKLNAENQQIKNRFAEINGTEPEMYMDGDKVNFITGFEYWNPRNQFETLEEAIDAFIENVKKNTTLDVPKYETGIYYGRNENGTIDYSRPLVCAKIRGFGVVNLKSFENMSEARKWLETHKEDVQQMAAAEEERLKKEKGSKKTGNARIKTEMGKMRSRVGNDYRGGQNVGAKEVMDFFGFRAIEFGNYVSQKERQDFLNMLYDSLMDLSSVIGISPRALSLGGDLAMAYGARGKSGASGHYEADRNVINITKTKGAGVLAHEWMHALDRYFSGFDKNRIEIGNQKYATSGKYSPNIRQEMKDAFVNLMKSIKSSEFYERSKRLSSYHSLDTELAARALQDYVIRRLEEKGSVNDFLSNHLPPEKWDGSQDTYPFPVGNEVEKIGGAFDNLFNAIQEKVDEETGNVVLFNIAPVSIPSMTESQQLAFDAVSEMLDKAGIPVEVLSNEQMEQLAGGGEAVLQARMDDLKVASRKILNWLKRNTHGDSFEIEIPMSAHLLAEKRIGHRIDSHTVNANEIIHARKRHGLKGTANTQESIPLRDEDIALLPYIMASPTRIEKGSPNVTGAKSIRYVKEISNGTIICVEYELPMDEKQMANITMWAQKKSSGYADAMDANQKTASYTTSETTIISPEDAAKIRKDAETAMADDIKSRLMTVYHGSGAAFDAFDHNFMGTGEGAQAYGWGSYVTEVKGIGKTYAEKMLEDKYKENRIINELARKTLKTNNGDKYASLEYLNSLLTETWTDKKRVRGQIKVIKSGKKLPEGNVFLYTVEIPYNTGENYLDWEKPMSDNQAKIIENAAKQEFENEMADKIMRPVVKGNDFNRVYAILSDKSRLGSDKAASEFLSRAGFVGISYPAQFTTGGRSDNAKNYVIFNEKDLQIKDRIQFMRGKRKVPDTRLPEDESSFKGTVVSSTDGAKIIKNLDILAKEKENNVDNRPRSFLGDVAKALGARQHGSKSQYATFETVNGQVVTIRLSDHNASTRNFDNAGRENGISIVISRKPNQGITNDGNARLVEFFYPDKALQKAEGKPLAEIVRSIKQALYSGEYTDTTGLAEVQEVNADQQEVRGGVVYGATVGGKIYMNGSALNPETPIHEYTHIWDIACQKSNPELWNRGVELMKQTPMWDEVKNDPNYADLKMDDEIASEVHSRLTGKDGTRILEDMAEQVKKDGTFYEIAKTNALISKLKKWLSDFWYWLKDTMAPWTKEEAQRVSLEDFINMPLKDLARGTDLRGNGMTAEEIRIIEEAKSDGTYMKAPNGNTGDFDASKPDIRFRISEPYNPETETISEFASRVENEFNGYDRERIAGLQSEIAKESEKASNAFNSAVKTMYDIARPLEKFQDMFAKQGALLDDRTDAYSDFFRSKARVSTALNEFEREKMKPIYSAISSLTRSEKLDNINDIEMLGGDKINDTRKITLYLQAKDIVEAKEKGLVDRGEDGFSEKIRHSDGVTKYLPEEYVYIFESNVGNEMVADLWSAVRNATKWIMDYQLEYGFVSQEKYDELMERQYYVPQRGFEEDEEQEREMEKRKAGQSSSVFNSALKKAKGRKTLADDPIPYIFSIAQSTAFSVEKNRTKQKAYNFVMANLRYGLHTGEFYVDDVHYEKTIVDGNLMYKPVYGYIPLKELFDDMSKRRELKGLQERLSKTENDEDAQYVVSSFQMAL